MVLPEPVGPVMKDAVGFLDRVADVVVDILGHPKRLGVQIHLLRSGAGHALAELYPGEWKREITVSDGCWRMRPSWGGGARR